MLIECFAEDAHGARAYTVEGEQFGLAPIGDLVEAGDADCGERTGGRAPMRGRPDADTDPSSRPAYHPSR